jgi:uncharacterized protein YciI
MKFAAIIEYHPDTSKVSAARPPHRAYLAEIKKAGKLVVAGPFTDMSGGLIVYEADSQEAAEQLIRSDPFFAHGVFVKWTIRPWNPVMTNRELLPENPPQ